ncbi:MAG: neutral/alkaline non-lysosomal ceramidase N-terminal domain-containing protein [Candidatus Omnitrophica bacterium]|nr:neutral/alkaline non-lysosomal ceramidase N-terminal domain-containing protein [Candidatus Omnitrophota bacterium]
MKLQIHLKGPVPLTAGVAKVEITPPVGTPLAGYSKRKGKPSTGVRDPLYARALVLSDGEDRVVLVSADLLVFPQPMAEALLKRISEETKLPPQSIILTTTHTHSGAGAIAPGFLYEIVFGSYRPEVVEGIIGRIHWAVRQALEKQQPVRWGTITGKGILGDLTENRRVPSGPTDPDVSLLVAESLEASRSGSSSTARPIRPFSIRRICASAPIIPAS